MKKLKHILLYYFLLSNELLLYYHFIQMFTQYSVYQLLPWIRTDKISFSLLSENPAAIHLLQQNPDKIDWQWLALNPSIFTYNYSELKRRMKETIAEDLMKDRFHPKHMNKWVGWGQEDEEEFE